MASPTLCCQRERCNLSDPYAVSMIEDAGATVDHVPRTVSAVCSTFLRRGGAMFCEVTGIRQYSSDLPQGRLEVLCTFTASPKEIAKLKKLLLLLHQMKQVSPSTGTFQSPVSPTVSINLNDSIQPGVTVNPTLSTFLSM